MIASRPIRLQTIQHHRRQDKIERDSFYKVDSSGFSGGTSWTNHKASKDGHTKRNDQSIQPSLSLACVYFICLFCHVSLFQTVVLQQPAHSNRSTCSEKDTNTKASYELFCSSVITTLFADRFAIKIKKLQNKVWQSSKANVERRRR